MTPIPNEIRPLVGIRAVATAWVVVFHLHPLLFRMLPSTAPSIDILASAAILAVDFFFMLSGFIITYRYLDELREFSRPHTVRYLALRFARIWPVHAATVIAFVVYHWWSERELGYGLEADNVGVENIVLNLVMWHQLPPGTAINPPAWSLAPEMGAYFAFPLLAVLLARVRSWRLAFGAAAVVLVLGGVQLWRLHDQLGGTGEWSYVVPWLRIATCFTAGCLLNVGWRLLPPRFRRSATWDAAALVAMGAVALVVLLVQRADEFRAPVLAYPFLALTVVACGGATGLVSRVLGSRVVEWAGRVSYSIYLTHFLVIMFAHSYLIRHGAVALPRAERALLVLLVLVAVLAVGALTYYLVEEPSRKGLRGVTHRHLGRVPPPEPVTPPR